jgi:hypothetical protein
MCAMSTPPNSLGLHPLGVIYRRSDKSVTMRCEKCGLQWTMTWAKIHQAAKAPRKTIGSRSKRDISSLAEATSFAAETKTPMERNKRKRVSRMGYTPPSAWI